MIGPDVCSGPWARELLGHRLVQPDQRSCGAAILVVARALIDEGYAELLVRGSHPTTGFVALGEGPVTRFQGETLAMHRRITGPVAASGRPQLPYPRPLGTPPWAVARQLSAGPAGRYVVRQARVDRQGVLASLRAPLARELPVALYVGQRWLPRHVLLLLPAGDDGPRCYDPAGGGIVSFTPEQFEAGALPGRWPTPWFVVRPR